MTLLGVLVPVKITPQLGRPPNHRYPPGAVRDVDIEIAIEPGAHRDFNTEVSLGSRDPANGNLLAAGEHFVVVSIYNSELQRVVNSEPLPVTRSWTAPERCLQGDTELPRLLDTASAESPRRSRTAHNPSAATPALASSSHSVSMPLGCQVLVPAWFVSRGVVPLAGPEVRS